MLPSMPSTREILYEFTANELRAFIDHYRNIRILNRRIKTNLVEALANSDKPRLDEMLMALPIKRVKKICRALKINSRGPVQEVLVARLLGHPEPKPRTKKIKKKPKSARGSPRGYRKPYKRKIEPGQKTLADFHNLAAQWHPTKNQPFTPASLLPGSQKKARWICPKNPEHVWEAQIKSRVRGYGCPYCSGLLTTKEDSLDAWTSLLDFRDNSGNGGIQTYHGATAGEHLVVCFSSTAKDTGGCSANACHYSGIGQWHHILYRWDGTTLQVYVDSELRWTSQPFGNVFSTEQEAEVTLGADQQLGANFNHFSNFYIDDLKIFNRVFTPRGQCLFVIDGTWDGASCTLP